MTYDSTSLPQTNDPAEIQKMGLDLLDKINKTHDAIPGVPTIPVLTNDVAYTPVFTNGTPGTNTQKVSWRQSGNRTEILFCYDQTVAGAAGAGNPYLISMPTGKQIDSTFVIFDSGATGYRGSVLGFGSITIAAAFGRVCVFAYDATHMLLGVVYGAGLQAAWGAGAAFSFANAALYVQFEASIPIAG